MFAYQSDWHCSKTHRSEGCASLSLLTSQIGTAPKLLCPLYWANVRLLTSQIGTAPKPDVRNMADSKWAEHRATASGQGEMNYIMRRTSKSNGSGLKKRIERDAPSLQRHLSTTYSSVYNNQRKAGKGESQALHIARQEAVGELNAYWKKVMPQYGYEYVTRKRSYKYNR